MVLVCTCSGNLQNWTYNARRTLPSTHARIIASPIPAQSVNSSMVEAQESMLKAILRNRFERGELKLPG